MVKAAKGPYWTYSVFEICICYAGVLGAWPDSTRGHRVAREGPSHEVHKGKAGKSEATIMGIQLQQEAPGERIEISALLAKPQASLSAARSLRSAHPGQDPGVGDGQVHSTHPLLD
ncbi:hypothetical protein KUCAC02_028986 [Chaenocephalus aceratus]|uniref:Uncharacterized protein n=1 Tax=Chaenocephalus aceratus TaxID=36190 RepID=A0ACB9X4D2_CHAAC|nr:hypothetical protein KUCAC02_028986 [Chaenocephalus aceratus]